MNSIYRVVAWHIYSRSLSVVVELVHDGVGRGHAQRCRCVENRVELHTWEGVVKSEGMLQGDRSIPRKTHLQEEREYF